MRQLDTTHLERRDYTGEAGTILTSKDACGAGVWIGPRRYVAGKGDNAMVPVIIIPPEDE